MDRKNNYAIQVQNAKKLFLSYDQEALVKKLRLRTDADYLYTALLGQPYRIVRTTGDLEHLENGIWTDANSFDEVLTQASVRYLEKYDGFRASVSPEPYGKPGRIGGLRPEKSGSVLHGAGKAGCETLTGGRYRLRNSGF